MKLIKSNHPDWSGEFTCVGLNRSGCGDVWLITIDDIFIQWGEGQWFMFRCPTCGEVNLIGQGDHIPFPSNLVKFM